MSFNNLVAVVMFIGAVLLAGGVSSLITALLVHRMLAKEYGQKS